MNDNYGEESCSDQEDLVGASASELDDDVTDMDEIQFSFCKATGTSNQNSSTNNNPNGGSGCGGGGGMQHNNQTHDIYVGDNYSDNHKSKFALFGSGFGLLVTSLMMLVVLPLYLRQLSLGGENYNAYGAIIYIGLMVGVLLTLLAAVFGHVSKWNIKFYKCPLDSKK